MSLLTLSGEGKFICCEFITYSKELYTLSGMTSREATLA